ncbi:MAG: IS3 family transposase [Pannonibacter sp.]
MRAARDVDITRKINTIHGASHKICGAPRMHAELKADGVAIGKKRVARLMCAAGLVGASRRTIWSGGTSSSRRPNELWVADITVLPMLAGFLFRIIPWIDRHQRQDQSTCRCNARFECGQVVIVQNGRPWHDFSQGGITIRQVGSSGWSMQIGQRDIEAAVAGLRADGPHAVTLRFPQKYIGMHLREIAQWLVE